MPKKSNKSPQTPLEQLMQAADLAVLRELVHALAARPEIRRKAIEFLQGRVKLDAQQETGARGEIAIAIWDELEPDLAELDQFGGGERKQEQRVGKLLDRLKKTLDERPIPEDDRAHLLDELIPFIRSRNSGMEDPLYGVAYAACQTDDGLRDFAERLEDLGQDWALDNARRIYRRIGDTEEYLALRTRRMEFGEDYHDLATFYWQQGQREEALRVAREGLEKGRGRMDDLRLFLAQRADEAGDRHACLELNFTQATDRLTLDSYQAFQKVCTPAEWSEYEPRLMAAVSRAAAEERLKIHVARGEDDEAIKLLTLMAYPSLRYEGNPVLEIAAGFERKYPEQVLAFYQSGLPEWGSAPSSHSRKRYAEQTQVVKKLRRVWIDVMKKPDEWHAFANKLKAANRARPAFLQEFARRVPGWNDL